MSITEPVAIPANINAGVTNAKQTTMLSLLGNPRDSYGRDCQEITNATLKKLVETRDLGRFGVTGLKPAVASLALVLRDIEAEQPDVYGGLGSAGMLCVRNVRDSTTSISNHSWGTAIDLTLNGILDRRGDSKVQQGLTRIAPIFNRHGWFWGAGFRTEDGMHFECGDALVRSWSVHAASGGAATTPPATTLRVGDRGPDVRELQAALNRNGAQIKVDGDFGAGTEKAVKAFQAVKGLTVDGVAGPNTLAALAL